MTIHDNGGFNFYYRYCAVHTADLEELGGPRCMSLFLITTQVLHFAPQTPFLKANKTLGVHTCYLDSLQLLGLMKATLSDASESDQVESSRVR